MTQDLMKLAERVEALTGPCRETDLAIFRALNPEYADESVWRPYANGLRHVQDGSDARCLPPPEATPSRFTASLDAAMSLVPAAYGAFTVARWWCDGDDKPPFYADCANLAASQVGDDCDVFQAWAATPALALTAAALRARATMEEV